MKREYLGVFPILAVLLCGCQANELESRCFPLLTVVDYEKAKDQVELGFFIPTPSGEKEGDAAKEKEKAVTGDSFETAWELYEQELNKYADYNHMKVMIIGEEFLKQQEDYENMLEVLQNKSEYPRNTYVCVVPDAWDFMEIKSLAKDPGTYLEEFLENQSKDGAYELPTIGRLMDLKENERGEVSIPKLRIEDEKIIWDGNYIMVPVEENQEFLENISKPE